MYTFFLPQPRHTDTRHTQWNTRYHTLARPSEGRHHDSYSHVTLNTLVMPLKAIDAASRHEAIAAFCHGRIRRLPQAVLT